MAAVREVAATAGGRVGKVASAAIREVSEAARERVGAATGTARERAADLAAEARRTAKGIAARWLTALTIVSKRARRTRTALEATAARAAVSMIRTGTKMLRATAEYVSPRRRVEPKAVEQLVVEQLDRAHLGTEAYDRTIAESEDIDRRMQLIRYKLQTIKQAETLGELLREIGGRVPLEERETPLPRPLGRDGDGAQGPMAVRRGLAHALAVAVQSAEGWRALDRIALWAEQDRLSAAIVYASEAVASEPEEQVEFLRRALFDETIQMVLG